MNTSENPLTPSLTQPSLSRFEDAESCSEIERMAAALMPAREVALLIGMTPEETDLFIYNLKNDINTPLSIAYKKGRLYTKLKLRKKVVDFALKGSPAAQPLADSYLQENDYL